MAMRKAVLNGSQLRAQDINMRARKLMGGPGITGRIEAAIPARAVRILRITRTVANAVSL